MENTLLLEQVALGFLRGIGPAKAKFLLSVLPDLPSLFYLPLKEIAQLSEFRLDFLKSMNREQALERAKEELHFMQQHQIQSFFFRETSYSRRLKQCGDSPCMLYSKGNVELNAHHYLAVVGTRNATPYGKKVCEELIESLAGKDIVVVSGMAFGIDIFVHQLCLKYDIATIGVLGHGLDRIYPSQHKETASRMLEKGGLLTEYVSNTEPDREHFPMRNRIVAGMCDATLVVESKARGGSLITANLANDYNRDVFAVPGNIDQPYSVGCNDLIQNSKANVYTSTKKFLEWMSWTNNQKKLSPQRPLFPDLAPDEKTIVDLLEEGEKHIDYLSVKSSFPISKTSVLLFQLEMAGILKSLPGKKYALY